MILEFTVFKSLHTFQKHWDKEIKYSLIYLIFPPDITIARFGL